MIEYKKEAKLSHLWDERIFDLACSILKYSPDERLSPSDTIKVLTDNSYMK
jgi:hypothetical protein